MCKLFLLCQKYHHALIKNPQFWKYLRRKLFHCWDNIEKLRKEDCDPPTNHFIKSYKTYI